MEVFIKTLLSIAIMGVFVTFGYSQINNIDAHDVTINIPEVALLDIEPNGSTITLGPVAPTEEGDPIDFSGATDNTLWMNYSSIVGSTTDPDRDVTVQITNGVVPGGMLLKVNAAGDANNGEGTVGTPTGTVTLSGTAQNIIEGVGSCYTNDGINNGHQLTYVLEQDGALGSYSNLDFDDATTLTITYTLTE